VGSLGLEILYLSLLYRGLIEWWIFGVDVGILGALLDGEFLEFVFIGSFLAIALFRFG
jgi:hypothetical protein